MRSPYSQRRHGSAILHSYWTNNADVECLITVGLVETRQATQNGTNLGPE